MALGRLGDRCMTQTQQLKLGDDRTCNQIEDLTQTIGQLVEQTKVDLNLIRDS